MAADYRQSEGKRTRKDNRRKLLVHEKVEMRSREDGFLGSWHSATVICCEDLARVIRFDHLLTDDGSDNLIEHVVVTPIIDGIVMGGISMPDNHRGTIRPFPPPCIARTRCLQYGECVDFFYEDAWWEGVVFDQEDGNEQRRIFFPDLGDEMEARVDMLRISQDWDEVTEEWKPRGNWLFLELIEEVEQDWPLPVSVKQIWYEVRVKSGFEKLKEWTSSARSIWRELVLQVLFDNFRIIVKQVFKDLNSCWDLAELGQLMLKYSEPALDAVLKFNGHFHNSLEVVSFEPTSQLDCKWMLPNDLNNTCCHQDQEQIDQVDLAPTSTMLTSGQAISVSAPALPIVSHKPDEASGIGSNNYIEGTFNTCFKSPSVELNISQQRKKLQWQPAIPVLVSGAEFCPNAMAKCTEMYRLNQRPPSTLILNTRKHLLHWDWKIEFAEDKGIRRVRYHSPDGELFFSLRQVCLKFKHFGQELAPVSQILSLIPTYGKISVASSPQGIPLSPHVEKSQCLSELAKLHAPDVVVIEPEYCPSAISDYYVRGSESKDSSRVSRRGMRLKALKAKKHLSATGWSFYYHLKRDNKREMRYSAPIGTIFYSLRSACKWCIEVNALRPSDCDLDLEGNQNVNAIKDFDDIPSVSESHLPLISMEPQGNFPLVNDAFEKLPNDSCDVSMSKGLVQLSEIEAHKTRIVQKKRKHGKPHYNDGSRLHKRGRKSRASMKVRGDMDAYSTPVVRSSRRTREVVVSSSHQTPRTVLSWLIDNNVVLPRAKVQYRCRKDGRPMAEGRISRDGIKCSCCHKIFTLSGFEEHAGSTNHRPSANIFFEDGKSLRECILQLKQHNGNRRLRSESGIIKANRNYRKNDYVCSVCHYGGELILCDECPSSFHACCIGLKEVPDGDWFCPSCCCGTCGQGGYGKRNDQIVDSSILICGQCERQYHTGCLRNNGAIKLDNCPDGQWFCQDTCAQIFYGLRKILGKPLSLGTENLAWTLVQYNKTDSCGHDASDNEDLMENYSKLNVALSVMHECFEPVKEPGSRRDLVEDVIFSRWSELKRLNFQGFYTVLLEKNDELISAATVRIYGKRVAEVPFIATRFQYRRLGMCRILMNELEKKLTELGVERLVLPAVPSVLNTWTTSFGFSQMNESERLNLLDYIFLDFQGTVICQKVLKSGPSSVSSLSTETWEKTNDHASESVSIELDGNSSLSEVFQADQAEKTEIVEQGSTCVARDVINNNNDDNGSAQLAIPADQPTLPNYISSPTKIPPESPVGVTSTKQFEDKNSAPILKFYTRRRTNISMLKVLSE